MMEYKIEKRYSCDGGVKVKYWVIEIDTSILFEIAIEPFDTYDQAEEHIYQLLMKE